MNVWLQLILTMAGVAGVVLGAGRWLLRGFDARVGAVVRAETGPQFAEIREQFVQVRGEFALVRAEMRDEFALVRAEARDEFALVRAEARDEFALVRAEARDEFALVRADVDGRSAGIHEQLIDLRHQAELTNLRLASPRAI